MAPQPRLSLCEWSLHREILEWQPRHLELPRVAKEVFGLEGVEYRSTFFQDKATDFGYLAEMRKRQDDAGVRAVLIEVDRAGPLGAIEDFDRISAVDAHFPWIAAAAFLGCESISVAAEGLVAGAPYLDWMADSLWRLAGIAKPYGISILVGNRTGLGCDGSWMASLIQRAADPDVGTHPHVDNFDLGGGRTYDRYRGLEEMMPWAKALSVRPDEPRIDLDRIARIAGVVSYAGWVGVEYDGPQKDERAGTKRAIELVRDAWSRIGSR
jgi:sugar phosphate isomerase/epimerase